MVSGAHSVNVIAAAPEEARTPVPEPRVTTLLDLVAAVSESAESEDEVVATITHLINSGAIRLIGNFQGADVRVG